MDSKIKKLKHGLLRAVSLGTVMFGNILKESEPEFQVISHNPLIISYKLNKRKKRKVFIAL